MKTKGRSKSSNIRDIRGKDKISDIIWKDNVKTFIDDSLASAKGNSKPLQKFVGEAPIPKSRPKNRKK